jgi:hypothetical protein
MKFAAILFWLLMILWLIGGIFWNRAERSPGAWGGWLLPWICLALLGWMATGNPFDK